MNCESEIRVLWLCRDIHSTQATSFCCTGCNVNPYYIRIYIYRNIVLINRLIVLCHHFFMPLQCGIVQLVGLKHIRSFKKSDIVMCVKVYGMWNHTDREPNKGLGFNLWRLWLLVDWNTCHNFIYVIRRYRLGETDVMLNYLIAR
jgi:hypothetical protein